MTVTPSSGLRSRAASSANGGGDGGRVPVPDDRTVQLVGFAEWEDEVGQVKTSATWAVPAGGSFRIISAVLSKGRCRFYDTETEAVPLPAAKRWGFLDGDEDPVKLAAELRARTRRLAADFASNPEEVLARVHRKPEMYAQYSPAWSSSWSKVGLSPPP